MLIMLSTCFFTKQHSCNIVFWNIRLAVAALTWSASYIYLPSVPLSARTAKARRKATSARCRRSLSYSLFIFFLLEISACGYGRGQRYFSLCISAVVSPPNLAKINDGRNQTHIVFVKKDRNLGSKPLRGLPSGSVPLFHSLCATRKNIISQNNRKWHETASHSRAR